MGNVRELENMIQRFVVLGDKEVILDELTSSIKKEPATIVEEKNQDDSKAWLSLKEVHREAIIKAETEVIRRALELTNWNRKKAASVLNISYKTLLYKIKECGINKQPASLWTQ
jgi:DNA-binding NtrC family response regulator